MDTKKIISRASVLMFWALSLLCSVHLPAATPGFSVKLSKEVLLDKIKGGWGGQTIGCTYGGPTEFKYSGIIGDDVKIGWNENSVKWYFDHSPGLYDDIYMDLTFVEVFQKGGLDAPIESFAKAYANAPYPLWHANKQGRYNILNGIMPPESGYWENNPHADDIDFQIEADYAGLMSPGMVNAAVHYSDGIGHIMNYGDGWYGGVYVAAMYALAFVSNDMNYVVTEALKTIPKQSKYYKAMASIIKWHKQYPTDWKTTWALFNNEYGEDIGCPDGVFNAFNIDAVVNSGYILIGLLYGNKDFAKTIDISTRCGQDSDCNPASAGGILGTMLGYSNIPEAWRKPLDIVADRPFVYTDISFNKASEYSFDQALKVIELNGGKVSDEYVTIKTQSPRTVRFEKSFEGHYPKKIVRFWKTFSQFQKFEFEGNGIVVAASYKKDKGYKDHGLVGVIETYLDGKLAGTCKNPTKGNGASSEIFYKYNLPEGKHTLTFKFVNKEPGIDVYVHRFLIYTGKEEAGK